MKTLITIIIVALACGVAIGVGVTKNESRSTDAGSVVGYGSSDSGNTIVRLKTDSGGILQLKGV